MRKVLYTGHMPNYYGLIVGNGYDVIGENEEQLKVRNELGGYSWVLKENFSFVNDANNHKTYGANEIREALIEHIKDINHQLSLKIGLDHSKEGGQDTATLMVAKSQALESLYNLVSGITIYHE